MTQNLENLMGEKGSITGLVEKLQQLKKSSNSKTVNSTFVFTIFYISRNKEEVEILRVIIVLPDVPDVREPI